MKRKLKGVLSCALTLVMVLSLAVAFAPVAAAADYEENDWDDWGLPEVTPGQTVGHMAVAPDGTIFAAVYNDDVDEANGPWWVVRSEDGGASWDDTELINLEERIITIVVSPNYEEDERVYVGVEGNGEGPAVYRLEEMGDARPKVLKEIKDGLAVATDLYSMDVWYNSDTDTNWIMVGTDVDVFVIEDTTFGFWIDQEISDGAYPDSGSETEWPVYEVAFAPDFDDSELMWALTRDESGDVDSDSYLVTSTIAPGRWGQEIAEAWLLDAADDYIVFDSIKSKIAFSDDYSSDPDDVPLLFVSLDIYQAGRFGGVWMFEGVEQTTAGTLSLATLLLDGDDNDYRIANIAVRGDVILAGSDQSQIVWRSDDLGESWDEVDKNPTGNRVRVYMAPGDFDPDEGVAYAATRSAEGGFSFSEDGGLTWNQIGIINTTIDKILDLDFHPDFPDTPTFLMITGKIAPGVTTSLWLTENGDDDEPDYVRVLCGDIQGKLRGNHDGEFYLVEYSWDGDAIYIFGQDDTDDPSTWRSTDDALTFGNERGTRNDAWINDWEIPLDDSIYAATTDGLLKSTNSGLSWTIEDDLEGMDINSICLEPGFDADDDDLDALLMGGTDGEVYISDNAGDSGVIDDPGLGLTGDVFVAFDADYADEDADGYALIYAAGQGGDVLVGEVDDPSDIDDVDDVDWDPLESDEGDIAQEVFATGLIVAPDNALYVLSAGDAGDPGQPTEVFASGEVAVEWGGEKWEIVPPEIIQLPLIGVIDLYGAEVTHVTGDFIHGEVINVLDGVLVTTGLDTGDTWFPVVTGTISVEGSYSGATGDILLTDYVVVMPLLIWELILYDWGWILPDWQQGIVRLIVGANLTCDVTGEAAVADEETALFRLLLDESNSEWESADDSDLYEPMGLWLTPGTNVLWTIDADDAELWNLEDTLSGQVTLNSPADEAMLDREDLVTIGWDEMRGIDEDYQYKLFDDLVPTILGFTDDLSITITGLSSASEYEWKVRAAPQSHDGDHDTWSSRWSDVRTFHTALGAPPWAPELYAPSNGEDAALLTPAFSWETAKNADGYTFMLADNSAFSGPLVDEKVSTEGYQPDVTLEYGGVYYWKVQALKGSEAISRWSDVSVFTCMTEPAPPPPPAPTPTLTVQPATPIILPTPIPPALLWTIIGIGAALIIAVIVLIARTRRMT